MRYTNKISMFPVGLVTSYGVSSPIVRNGSIDGFYDGWIGGRKFPVDMAGFAVNVKFFLSRPKAKMPFSPGYEEDGFLKSLAPFELKEIDLLASNCSEVGGILIGSRVLAVQSGPILTPQPRYRFSFGTHRPRRIQWRRR